ncbi:MAG: hypothetical protein Q8L78_07675 [Coxiellaceae bacterium]|nr:hypothetical protein [Coxiellaceae bacterium]
MKDYAKRNSATLKPNRHSTVQTPFNADRWLVVFIVCALILAALSASYTFYQKWQQKHTGQVIVTTAIPVKTALEKIARKPSDNKPTTEETPTPKNSAKLLKKKTKTIETTVADNKPDTIAEPKYDFYQILPKMTVDVQKNTNTN